MVRFIPLGGFLGAGKTTTMVAAAKLLESRGERVSLVTNDQGVDLVDTELAKASGLGSVAEVTGGCFCCRFNDLATVVTRLVEQVNPTVIIAEAVGSCTDLQSTVVRPLREFYGDRLHTAPLTVILDPFRHTAMAALTRDGSEPDLAYLYRHQLDEADIIAVNKTDLLTAAAVDTLRADLTARYPHARLVAYSATTGHGLTDLINTWNTTPATQHVPFAIDYDRYAAAEAELAWTNQTFTVTGSGFSPRAWTDTLLTDLSDQAAALGATVGHIKVLVSDGDRAAKASLTQAGAEPSVDQVDDGPRSDATVTFNARVQLPPDHLNTLIDAAIATADAACDTTSGERAGDIFQPAYPTPVHRL